MSETDAASEEDDWGPLSALPGNPLMWVLIGSELAVFGIALLGYCGARLRDPAGFAEAQNHLDRLVGLINTATLLTSGWFAALGPGFSPRKDGGPPPDLRSPRRAHSASPSSL